MRYRSDPVTMWFDRRLVLRPSPIHGVGTYALEAIYAGETLIWVTGGLVYSGAEWHSGNVRLAGELYNEESLADDLFIATPKVFNYYINHSCDANAIDQSRRPNWTHYIACRDIGAGEEVTTDYALYGDANFESCSCGSQLCRGRVSAADRLLPEVRRRYGAYFHFDAPIEPAGAAPLPNSVSQND